MPISSCRCNVCVFCLCQLLEDRPFSKAVDVYAFGMVLWEMFARQIPFAGWRPADIKEGVSVCRPRERVSPMMVALTQ